MRIITKILILSVIASVIICCPDGWKYESKKSKSKDLHVCSIDYSYGRGGGYGLNFGDASLKGAKRRCEKAHPELGCELWGAVYYPKCKEYYTNDACCFCSIKNPPSGYKYGEIDDARYFIYKKDD